MYYIAAKPCHKGHTPIRYVKSRDCVFCVNSPRATPGGDEGPLDTPAAKLQAKLDQLMKELPPPEPRTKAVAEHLRYRLGYRLGKKPCKQGHIRIRFASTGQCYQCNSRNPNSPLVRARARAMFEQLAAQEASQA